MVHKSQLVREFTLILSTGLRNGGDARIFLTDATRGHRITQYTYPCLQGRKVAPAHQETPAKVTPAEGYSSIRTYKYAADGTA